MQWSEMFDEQKKPTDKQIKEYVGTAWWNDLAKHLGREYRVEPKLFYSCCSMQKGYWKGWNVKYKKGGKALCTLYPKQGYFVALIAVGEREQAGADLLIPLCDAYTQSLYRRTEPGARGKSLAVEVTSDTILRDVKNLIALRVPSCKR